jgi:hypothetical protein
MKFCRINLDKTDYNPTLNFTIFVDPPVSELQEIYKKYCKYKEFDSVMPIFDSQFKDIKNTCIGYHNRENQLVAFSLIRHHSEYDAEALQFAWDYEQPELRLGIESLKTECAFYKAWGFRYLYLGQVAGYKSQFDGYEELGTL